MTAPTLGVFDSGVGGLTVMRALRHRLPGLPYLYLGDTARLPYGSKSQATVARYAVESARFLAEHGATILVIACNTASALALDSIREAVAPVPVLGVVHAGIEAARGVTATGDICVLATAATVASHAYSTQGRALGLRVAEKACPLLVPLVEEGWIAHPVTRDVLRIYLGEALALCGENGLDADTLVLGCTHYPVLRAELAALAPQGCTIIDSAAVMAAAVAARLPGADSDGVRGPARFFATDGPERFRTLGSRFLGEPIDRVELVDLGG